MEGVTGADGPVFSRELEDDEGFLDRESKNARTSGLFARSRGVWPFESLMEKSAEKSRKASRVSKALFTVASCAGVAPALFRAFGLAPALISRDITSLPCPNDAAQCKSVASSGLPSVLLAFIPPANSRSILVT